MGIVDLRHLDGLKGNFILNETDHLSIIRTSEEGKIVPLIIQNNFKEIVEQQRFIFDTFWNKTIFSQEKIRQIEEGVEPSSIDVIRDRKRAEFLLIYEIRRAKSEALIAIDSIKYLENLIEIGLLESLKQAKAKGVNIMILYSEEYRNDATTTQLISAIKIYCQIKSISGIQGSILLIDNSKVLTLNEQGADCIAVYSDNEIIVKNLGSLLDALWSETEILDAIIAVKDDLADSNKQLALANEQLKTQKRIQEEFINIAAHELRTPITPILGSAELLEAELEEEEEEEKRQRMRRGERQRDNNNKNNKTLYIKAIVRGANRLVDFSEFILDIAKIESDTLILKKEELNLNDIILTAMDHLLLNIMKDSARKKVKLRYEPSEHSILVDADRIRLTQVISNLLSNANKFTKEGVISITTKKKDNQQVIVSVKDTGTGIDPEILSRLFSKFSSRSTSGTGLGLFICKSIIEAHGGNIWAENNRDCKGGATFTFSLPLANEQSE
jgi:two-component system sensor histidine kinase VicK